MSSINFFAENINYKQKNEKKIKEWIKKAISIEKHKLFGLNIVFCSDKYLLRLNEQYLKHDTYTDVITFDYSRKLKEVYGDIFISIDRILENYKIYSTSFDVEVETVIIHGVLHLMQYNDLSEKEKLEMRALEKKYLTILKNSTDK